MTETSKKPEPASEEALLATTLAAQVLLPWSRPAECGFPTTRDLVRR